MSSEVVDCEVVDWWWSATSEVADLKSFFDKCFYGFIMELN